MVLAAYHRRVRQRLDSARLVALRPELAAEIMRTLAHGESLEDFIVTAAGVELRKRQQAGDLRNWIAPSSSQRRDDFGRG